MRFVDPMTDNAKIAYSDPFRVDRDLAYWMYRLPMTGVNIVSIVPIGERKPSDVLPICKHKND